MRFIISLFSLLILQLNNIAIAAVAVKEKPIASLTSEPIGIGSYLQMFFGLFIVVAIIFAMAWFMRRMGGLSGMNTGSLKVLGGISVGQRERVVLIQAGETQLLVGVAPGQIRTLHVMDEPITTTIESKTATGFAEKLHTAMKNRNNA